MKTTSWSGMKKNWDCKTQTVGHGTRNSRYTNYHVKRCRKVSELLWRREHPEALSQVCACVTAKAVDNDEGQEGRTEGERQHHLQRKKTAFWRYTSTGSLPRRWSLPSTQLRPPTPSAARASTHRTHRTTDDRICPCRTWRTCVTGLCPSAEPQSSRGCFDTRA